MHMTVSKSAGKYDISCYGDAMPHMVADVEKVSSKMNTKHESAGAYAACIVACDCIHDEDATHSIASCMSFATERDKAM